MIRLPPTLDNTALDRVLNHGEAAVTAVRRFFAGYFWAILKNVVGWLLILLAFPVGVALPGPGGLPMFLIGFALVAFPGKRKITSHVLRGRPLRIEASIFTSLTTITSLIVIATLLWVVGEKYQSLIHYFKLDPAESTPAFIAAVAGVCVIAAGVTWAMMRLGLLFANKLIRVVPRIRRLIRPFLRKWGVVLLPPPRRQGPNPVLREALEILEFSDSSRERIEGWWRVSKPWVRRSFAILLTALLLYFVIDPVANHWRQIEPVINRLRPMQFVVGVFLLAGYLVLFRVTSWQWVNYTLRNPVPLVPAIRIWSTSELSRYLPGGLWQLATRVFLAKPYGVSSARCVSSHVTELAILLLANFLVGSICLLFAAFSRVQGDSKWWITLAMLVVPLITLMLTHPHAFYRITNGILNSLGKPPVEVMISGPRLVIMLLWNIVGTLLLGVAVWTVIADAVNLPLSGWWIAAGAYSVAWTAGFIATWAPAGLGVREIVFMGTLLLFLPPSLRQQIPAEALIGVAGLLALILRVWATVGELIVVVVAYALDVNGALASVRGERTYRSSEPTTPTLQ